jgi:predicted PurR-regulated permease PerM
MRAHGLRVYATLYVFIFAAFVLWQGTKLVATPFIKEFKAAVSPEGRQQMISRKGLYLGWYNQNVPDWARSDQIKKALLNSDAVRSAQRVLASVGASFLESLKNIVEIVLLPVLAFYFVIDGRTLKHEFVALLPRARRREALRILREFNLIMRAFVVGQFILCVLAGLVVGTGLAMLHVKYALILGVLAGITRAIPIIGPIIGGIPIILLTLVTTEDVTVALEVLTFFTVLHLVESKFIMPWLIGDRIDLHPVIIIVALIVGGEMGGLLFGGQTGALLGMFLAAPLAATARVVVRRYWLGLRPGGAHTEGGGITEARPDGQMARLAKHADG